MRHTLTAVRNSATQGLPVVVTVSGSTLQVSTPLGKVVPYRLDAVLPPASTQSDVFREVEPLVAAAVAGYNSTVFAYGQTGTGKTHTMLGVDLWGLATTLPSGPVAPPAAPPPDSLGVIPRCMARLFALLDAKRTPDSTIRVWASYLEVYNERVFDLLSARAQDRAGPGLDVRQDKVKGVFIQVCRLCMSVCASRGGV